MRISRIKFFTGVPIMKRVLILMAFTLIPLSNSAATDLIESTSMMENCEVSISPESVYMYVSDTQQFTASTVCGGEHVSGTYTWETDGGVLNTTSGDVVIYSAVGIAGEDTLTVTDTANGNITDTATIHTIIVDCFLFIYPYTLMRSRWIPIPTLIQITNPCSIGIGFDASTRVFFNPKISVLPMPIWVINDDTILQLLFVMPSWFAGQEDELVEVTVSTGDDVLSALLDIHMLPLLLDEQKESKYRR